MVPSILMAIGLADSLHLIVSYTQLHHKKNSSRLALEKNIVPTFLTSLSTAIGFFSLASSDIASMQHLGVLCGVGSLLAWVFSILLVIPCLKWYEEKTHVEKYITEIKSIERKQCNSHGRWQRS